MLPLLHLFFQVITPLLVPICFVCAWGLVLLVASSLWSVYRDGITVAKQMRQIPCTNCQFFTNDYRLKCTVRPTVANTEAAIDCMDYQAKTNSLYY